jgi:hypothetical protein
VGDTVRCPWHHACFSFRNGEAQRAPGLDPVPCWRVERLGDKIFVRERVPPLAPKRGTEGPSSVVIVGGGAAGLAAAEMLRREGYDGPLTIVSADASPPVDRPNLSKDYLAGTARKSGCLCGSRRALFLQMPPLLWRPVGMDISVVNLRGPEPLRLCVGVATAFRNSFLQGDEKAISPTGRSFADRRLQDG